MFIFSGILSWLLLGFCSVPIARIFSVSSACWQLRFEGRVPVFGPRESKKMARTLANAKKESKDSKATKPRQAKAKAEGKNKGSIQYKSQKKLNDFHDPASVFAFHSWCMEILYNHGRNP